MRYKGFTNTCPNGIIILGDRWVMGSYKEVVCVSCFVNKKQTAVLKHYGLRSLFEFKFLC
jgi:hypothetical protein